MKRIAFFICGIAAVLIGRVYSGLQLFTPLQTFTLPAFFYVLLFFGVSAVCISFLPTAWFQSVDGGTQPHRFTPFRFLLSFAALGLFLVVVSSFVPSSVFRPSIPLVYSLCPACVMTAAVDPSLTTILCFIAPVNALVFGAIGGVIGTTFSIMTR